MNQKTRSLLLLGTISATLGFAAELAPTADRPNRPSGYQNRIASPSERPKLAERMPAPPNARRVKATHLGVGVAPSGPSLAAQLGLAPNTGLVVTNVEPNSPANEKIRPHDVLVEIDGQLLINPEQFAVLIRNHRAGDEVTLKLIRGGKAETLKIALSEHEVFIHEGPMAHAPMPIRPGVRFPGGTPLPAQPSIVERQIEVKPRNAFGNEPPLRQRRVVVRDQAGSIELNSDERGRTVNVQDAKGETIFTGPLNSPADFEAIPEAIRRRLDKIPEARAPLAPSGRE